MAKSIKRIVVTERITHRHFSSSTKMFADEGLCRECGRPFEALIQEEIRSSNVDEYSALSASSALILENTIIQNESEHCNKL